jgi:hypothetical protein
VALTAIGAVGFGGFALYAAWAYGGIASWIWVALAVALFAGAAIGGSVLLLRRQAARAAAIACGLGILGHDVLLGAAGPTLKPLWLSERVAEALAQARLNPRQGLAAGPVTVAGYGEPSIVFALGASTELADAPEAVQAVAEGRPAVVEGAEEAAFQKGLANAGLAARMAGVVSGLDYSTGHPQILRIYEPASPAGVGSVSP